MKSFTVAALISAVAADGLLGGVTDSLSGGDSSNGGGLVGDITGDGKNGGLLGNLIGDKTGLDLGVELPAGISIDASLGPKYPPPANCINIWHPPHHGVDMDGCDNHDDNDWHYVHPCDVCDTDKHHTWTTKTEHATITKTITDCPETVTDCPLRTSVVVTATTTICPVEVTHTMVPTVTVAPTSTMMPPQTMVTSYCDETTQAPPAPPAPTSVVVVQPPPGNNGTMTMPPVTGAGARVEAGIVAAFGAVAALFL
ncbi:hypothetical protein K4F52_004261 [Lecanicillium sp. MT-2017a]|nr:hypothetical protein K4F52_004261 [Lecanicillium sp. MT-2017a]